MFAKLTTAHAPRAKASRRSGRTGKIYYATQVATAPPTIACFVSNVAAFDHNYRRYLLNHLREHLPFTEVPIRLIFRPRPRREKPE